MWLLAGARRLLAAPLHVALHELLGVLVEDLVDLVQEVVEVLLDLLALLGDLRIGHGGALVSFFFCSAMSGPLLAPEPGPAPEPRPSEGRSPAGPGTSPAGPRRTSGRARRTRRRGPGRSPRWRR